jgi:multidrug efflux pump subunit AcrA (membrane-fusion protein)
MLASVTLSSGPAATVLAVPREAIAWDGMRAFVFVQRADGVLERRAVETGRMDDRYVEIVNGLKAAEMIAVSAIADLQTAYATLR